MSQANTAIKCRKCGMAFEPDMKTKGKWPCPSCQTKNPNLKRHYRAVADLCILGLAITLIGFVVWIKEAGLNLFALLWAADAVLLLVTIVFVYKSKAPWADNRAKILIWVVFGVALLCNVGVPLILSGELKIPAIIVYAVVFPYLFWLNMQAGKCTVSEPPKPPAATES
jgi:uncharacterized membrane protein